MIPRRFALVAGLAVVVAAAAWVTVNANNAPHYGAAAREAWREVEQQFRARADMVPEIIAMVETVNATQGALVEQLRDAQAKVLALPAQPEAPTDPARFRTFMDTQDNLSRTLGKVMDLMNLYPDRRSNPEIRQVLDALETRENRIVVARSDFVNLARNYNLSISRVPDRWVALAFLGPQPLMIETFDRPRNS
jgi:Uncharacterized conserved protein